MEFKPIIFNLSVFSSTLIRKIYTKLAEQALHTLQKCRQNYLQKPLSNLAALLQSLQSDRLSRTASTKPQESDPPQAIDHFNKITSIMKIFKKLLCKERIIRLVLASPEIKAFQCQDSFPKKHLIPLLINPSPSTFPEQFLQPKNLLFMMLLVISDSLWLQKSCTKFWRRIWVYLPNEITK